MGKCCSKPLNSMPFWFGKKSKLINEPQIFSQSISLIVNKTKLLIFGISIIKME